MKKTLMRLTGGLLVVLGILALAVLRPVDATPYRDLPEYPRMMAEIAQTHADNPAGPRRELLVGWARELIADRAGTPLAGFGRRAGKPSAAVRDPVWVRAVAFDDGRQPVALVSLDLLLVSPGIRREVLAQLRDRQPRWSRVFFMATHTHSSIGGWLPGLIGEAVAGPYDAAVEQRIAAVTVAAIEQAIARREPAVLGQGRVDGGGFVESRRAGGGATDPWVRYLLIRTAGGQTAVLSFFGAHPTCLGSRSQVLSRDYPGALVDALEALEAIDFAVFGAGAVGSQKPAAGGSADERLHRIGTGLAAAIAAGLREQGATPNATLAYHRLPLRLRSPQWRVSESLRLAPGLFHWLLGDNDPALDLLRLGDVLLIGVPCDFSAELVADLDAHAARRGLALVIAGFNGGYIGYVSPERSEAPDGYEDRDMNWYGPGSGSYLQDVVRKVIDVSAGG